MSLGALALGAAVGLATAVPSPTPVEESLELRATPGLTGFLVMFALALAAIGLFLSLTRHLRVVDRRARQLADTQPDDALPDGAAPDGGAPDGGAPAGAAPDGVAPDGVPVDGDGPGGPIS